MGESDEKLADRIKLFAVLTVPQAKRSILNDLISVSTFSLEIFFECSFSLTVLSVQRTTRVAF